MFEFLKKPAGNNNQQQPNNQQPNQQQQQQAPGGWGNGNPQNNQQQPNNGNGGNTDPNAGKQQPEDPLAWASKMFDNDPNAEQDKGPPRFSIDGKVMDEVVSKQDFLKGIDPELQRKAMSGDADAFAQMFQQGLRNVYRSSIEHNGALTDRFVSSREEYSGTKLSGKIKGELTTSALSKTPNFQNPVVKKQLTEFAQRLQKQHPDAAPEEIAEAARKYVTDLANALNPQTTDKDSNSDGSPKEVDWNNYFD